MKWVSNVESGADMEGDIEEELRKKWLSAMKDFIAHIKEEDEDDEDESGSGSGSGSEESDESK